MMVHKDLRDTMENLENMELLVNLEIRDQLDLLGLRVILESYSNVRSVEKFLQLKERKETKDNLGTRDLKVTEDLLDLPEMMLSV